jgi:tetratricopeptide (TPR) repeat protein
MTHLFMKRIVWFLLFAFVAVAGYAQPLKLLSAWNYMKPDYNELDKAKEALDEAVVHKSTIDKAITWYYRAKCYHRIYQSTDKNIKGLHPDPLSESYISYLRVKELDTKKRRRYRDTDLQVKIIATEFFNQGADRFKAKQYAKALTDFEMVLEITRSSVFDQVDTTAFFYAALAADQAGMYDKALNYYKKALQYKTQGSDIYHYMANLHKTRGDTVAAIKSYQTGIEAFPKDNTYLYIQLINYYLAQEDYELAAKYIEPAVEKDPDNAGLWNVYGSTFEDIDLEKAIFGYKRALDLDSTRFDIFYNLGTIYFNQGVDANDRANELPIYEEDAYSEAIQERDTFFKQALPYYEKAFKLDNTVPTLVLALREIYLRLMMEKELEEIEALIESRK